MTIDGGQVWTMYQAVESITDQLGVYVCMHAFYVHMYVYVCIPFSTLYLVLQVLRLLLLVVAPVYAPDKVVEVVLEELLTFSLTH